MKRALLVFALVLTIPATLSAAGLDPGLLQTTAPTGRVVVKFTGEAELTVTDAGLTGPEAARLNALLEQIAPGYNLERRFSRPAAELSAERRAAEARSGRVLPDLNRYATLDGLFLDRDGLIHLVRKLMADPAVETAFLDPVVVPAALGFDAFTGAVPEPARAMVGARDDTPDFTDQQGYLEAPPLGVNAWAVADSAGADGATVQVVDIEGAWLWTHEDLPAPFLELGGQYDNLGWRNHGTAVMGEIRGTENGYGVRGIVPAASVGASSIAEQWVAEAINNASALLDPGDIILIELHGPGPNANGEGQFGYVCMEFWQDSFDAIQLATARGVIVCEAAGNGQQDLDDPVYQNLFDRSVRDSGAIMCGASNGSLLEPAWFTNYGSRVDLHGWGYEVVSCGYGTLQGEPLTEERWYTNSFSGTSSASPIVVGSVAALQGMAEARWGFPLDARLARDLLVATGTAQEQPEIQIGPRPDVLAAWQLALDGIGEIAGTVTDAGTSLPLEGTLVEVRETGSFDVTDAAGAYRLALPVGDYTLDLSHTVFYEPASAGFSILDGQTSTQDVALVARPTMTIAGYVQAGASPAVGARVRAVNLPLPDVHCDGSGYFAFTGVPEDTSLVYVIDSLPGYSAWAREASTTATPGDLATYYETLQEAEQDFEADDGDFTPDSLWTWGVPLGDEGPVTGFSGDRCWGVGMSSDYGDDEFAWLTSPAYDITVTGMVGVYLSFHYWSETESGFDGARVECWDYYAEEWEPREPVDGYSDIILGGVSNLAGWSGSTGGWVGTIFDIEDLVSPEFRFRIAFGSDGGVNGPGFWIDDVAFVMVGWPTGAGETPQAALALEAWPNPFNPRLTLRFQLENASPVKVEVFDTAGRRVATLLDEMRDAGPQTLVWDGHDAAGRPLSSGVYHLRLIAGEMESSRKVVLLR